MKSVYILAFIIFLFSSTGFSQDTSKYKVLQKVNVNKKVSDSLYGIHEIHLQNQSHVMYRDTRLGSSSPLYNTYKKNDYGAGSITTNPNKSDGPSFIYAAPTIKTDSLRRESDSMIHH